MRMRGSPRRGVAKRRLFLAAAGAFAVLVPEVGAARSVPEWQTLSTLSACFAPAIRASRSGPGAMPGRSSAAIDIERVHCPMRIGPPGFAFP